MDLYENKCEDCDSYWLSNFKDTECLKCKSAKVKSSKMEGVQVGKPKSVK